MTPDRDLYPAVGTVANPLRIRRPHWRIRLRWAQGRDAYGSPLTFVEVSRDRWARVSLEDALEPARAEVVPFVLAYRRGLLGPEHVFDTSTLVEHVRGLLFRALPRNPRRREQAR